MSPAGDRIHQQRRVLRVAADPAALRSEVCVRNRIFATLATMYPRLFFDTYWRSSLRKEVFVAMSFAHEFDGVWNDAIRPAIERDLADSGGSYRAHRVDISKISDSIHREILDGIAHATLVFADISVMQTGDWKGQRNGNVMFALGIAQSVRPATDLIVVRSDRKKINFDINHIRIHRYNRTNPAAARKLFADCLVESLKQRKAEKSLRAVMLRDRLDVDSMNLMVKVWDEKGFNPFTMGNCTADERRTAARLLDLGIIRCVTPDDRTYHYEWTDFGKHCYNHPNRK